MTRPKRIAPLNDKPVRFWAGVATILSFFLGLFAYLVSPSGNGEIHIRPVFNITPWVDQGAQGSTPISGLDTAGPKRSDPAINEQPSAKLLQPQAAGAVVPEAIEKQLERAKQYQALGLHSEAFGEYREMYRWLPEPLRHHVDTGRWQTASRYFARGEFKAAATSAEQAFESLARNFAGAGVS
jgi:hypothetical protein